MSALAHPRPGPTTSAAPQPPLPYTSVLLMILLAVVTLGISIPVWFLLREKAFNALRSKVKMTPALPVAALGILLAAYGTEFLGAVLTGLGAPTLGDVVGLGAGFLRLAEGVVIFLLAFRVRDILQDHLRARVADYGGSPRASLLAQSYWVSGILTFFFNAFYLQSKINDCYLALTSAPE
jgi:hypothetical protein